MLGYRVLGIGQVLGTPAAGFCRNWTRHIEYIRGDLLAVTSPIMSPANSRHTLSQILKPMLFPQENGTFGIVLAIRARPATGGISDTKLSV